MNRSITSLAVIVLAACADTAPDTFPAPPSGLEVAWAFDDCAPWDGAAATIYLAADSATGVREAPYPHLWVSLYVPSNDLVGRTFRWDESDKNTGGAMWCLEPGRCEAAIAAEVTVREGTDDTGVFGVIDLTFPTRGRVTGGFRAAWMSHELLCG